jgi:transcriptional regulator with XRE-family HTH domain
MDTSSIPPELSSGSPALFKRMIALSLLRWRNEAGLSQKDSAKRLDRTAQHISLLEGGERPPSAADMEILLGFYGRSDDVPFMRELLTAAKRARNWWTAFSGVVPKWFDLFLGLESGAAELSSFDTFVVPGLLQTRDYAEAVLRGNPDLDEDEITQLLDLRMARQQILDREDEPVRLWTVLDESVLYRQCGSAEIMQAQLKHLLKLSKRPRIDIQVLPLNAGAGAAPDHDGATFEIMKFPPSMENDPGLVYLEPLTGGQYIERPDHIAAYERALTRVQALAPSQRASRAIIERAMKEVT